MQQGDYYSYSGGGFVLDKSNLNKALKIGLEEMDRDIARLKRWRKHPAKFAGTYDMINFGPKIINSLLVNHLRCSRDRVRKLKDLVGGYQMEFGF